MKIQTVALLLVLLTGSQLFSLPVGAAALSYEPTVELKGTVVMEEHFGAPGFGEDPMTDARDLLAFLILDEPYR